ncbi:hypothetical protein LTR64_008283 [Lithohypha guttulata]|uniref:uncharacterized protein n=1 Tax=Lithohypha guttulata TaxID=1690604 RepID=UPI002DE03CC6|nr:hypothetical protein LTR51_008435 [Lithohypha guttulata]
MDVSSTQDERGRPANDLLKKLESTAFERIKTSSYEFCCFMRNLKVDCGLSDDSLNFCVQAHKFRSIESYWRLIESLNDKNPNYDDRLPKVFEDLEYPLQPGQAWKGSVQTCFMDHYAGKNVNKQEVLIIRAKGRSWEHISSSVKTFGYGILALVSKGVNDWSDWKVFSKMLSVWHVVKEEFPQLADFAARLDELMVQPILDGEPCAKFGFNLEDNSMRFDARLIVEADVKMEDD